MAARWSWTASKDIDICLKAGSMDQDWILISKLSFITCSDSAETQWLDTQSCCENYKRSLSFNIFKGFLCAGLCCSFSLILIKTL